MNFIQKINHPFKILITSFMTNSFVWITMIAFLSLVIAGISGSSIGYMDKQLTGKTPYVLIGTPRLIRSDEWVIQTQETLAQARDNFPSINKKIGNGEDMSIIADVPFKNIFALFKPQNLFFFVLPFTEAFAAKWWFMSLVLVLGFYFLIDALFPQHRLLAALGSLVLLFNPFIQWWYQSITLLTIGYALWSCFFLIKIFGQKRQKYRQILLHGVGLTFATLCFMFCLYPPFQISVTYVVLGLIVGFFLYRYLGDSGISIKNDSVRWVTVITSAVIVLSVSLLFYLIHKTTIQTIINTSYPGNRTILSGSPSVLYNFLRLFSSPTLINLQKNSGIVINNIFLNQSEASLMVPINLVLLPLGLYELIKTGIKKWRLDHYMLLSTSIITLLFIVRLLTTFNFPFKILLFNIVPNQRLAIGIALLCVVQVVLLGISLFRRTSLFQVILVFLYTFFLFFISSYLVYAKNPGFISFSTVVLTCSVIAVSVCLLSKQRYFILGLVVFLLFNMSSSLFVNPLNKGAESLTLTQMTNYIHYHYAKSHKVWLVLSDFYIENIPMSSGVKTISGTMNYPQLSIWKHYGPNDRNVGAYNQYANILFENSPGLHQVFNSPSVGTLLVKLNCVLATRIHNLGYVMSVNKILPPYNRCFTMSHVFRFRYASVYIYKFIT